MEVTKSEFEILNNKLGELIKEINNLTIKKEWYEGVDNLRLVDEEISIELECNYDSWLEVKRSKKENGLYIAINDNGTLNEIGLSLHQMKQINNYLNDKIVYLEG